MSMGPEKILTLFAVATILLVGPTLCCKCPKRTNEDIFCSANYAIRAMVLDHGRVVEGRKIYRIMPYRLYKSSVPSYQVNLFRVTTGTPRSSSCGVNLTPGDYLFTGYFETIPNTQQWYGHGRRRKRQLNLNLCDWIQRYDTLTSSQRRFIGNPNSCPRV